MKTVAKTMKILTVVVAATSINSNGENEKIKKLEEVSDTCYSFTS